MRALAQRSSESAREIKAQIKASSEHVAAGVKLVGESGEALRGIVSRVIKIDSLVTEISQAAQQRSTGIEEFNTAVTQIDQVTQQNAAMVEQSTAAARSLAGETSELAQLVAFFRVGAADVAPIKRSAQAERPRAPAPTSRPTARPQAKVAVGGRRTALAAPAGERDDWKEF